MNRFVLDCSVSAAWCLQDETTSQAQAILNRLVDGEALVPTLWTIEMANMLVVAERRGRIKAEEVPSVIDLLLELPINMIPEDKGTLSRVYALAHNKGLSAYDACYLDLAIRTGLPLATLDQSLSTAAKACQVSLLTD